MKENIGRPKEFNVDEALQIAMYHFWEHGYHNSSLSDLLATMAIKKSSFYQTFKSKENLFKMALELYTQQSALYLNSLHKQFGAKGALLELMQGLLAEVKDTGSSKGCLVMNSGGECYRRYGHLSPLVKKKFAAFQKLFMDYIIQAQKLGEITSRSSPFVLVTNYQCLLNGAAAMVRAGAGENEMKVLIAQTEELLR